jgi:hypothetical protein
MAPLSRTRGPRRPPPRIAQQGWTIERPAHERPLAHKAAGFEQRRKIAPGCEQIEEHFSARRLNDGREEYACGSIGRRHRRPDLHSAMALAPDDVAVVTNPCERALPPQNIFQQKTPRRPKCRFVRRDQTVESALFERATAGLGPGTTLAFPRLHGGQLGESEVAIDLRARRRRLEHRGTT